MKKDKTAETIFSTEDLKKDLGICVKCKKNKATLTFAESILNWSHGFFENLCQNCYDKIQKESPLYKLGYAQAQEKYKAEVEKVLDGFIKEKKYSQKLIGINEFLRELKKRLGI